MALKRKSDVEGVGAETVAETFVAAGVGSQHTTPSFSPEAAAAAEVVPVQMKGLMFDGMKDKLFADFGTLPRLRATNGNIFDDKDRNLGQHAVIQIISWNLQYVMDPCDNKAPSELVRYSYDSKVIDDGTGDTIADYILALKASGHACAACKTYGELVCVLLSSQKQSDLVGEMVTVQLSPTSLKAFEGYKLQRTFKASQGMASPDESEPVRLDAELAWKAGRLNILTFG